MESFGLAVNVVFPLLLMMACGCFMRYRKMIDDHTINYLNKMLFRFFMAVMLFMNTYKMNLEDVLNPQIRKLTLIITICYVFIVTVLIMILPKFVTDRSKCGVMIQGFYRSNLILYGLPVFESIYGSDDSGMVSVLISVIIQVINILSAIVLEIFGSSGGRLSFRKILKSVVLNPLVQGPVVGLLFLVLGIHFPKILEDSLRTIGGISTPLAFVVLGATIQLKSIRKNWKYISFTVLGKLFIVPLIVFIVCYCLGMRRQMLVMVLGAMASPTAVASFAMAKEAGCDEELAGEIVMASSVCSLFSIFAWVFFLGTFRLI